VVSGKVLAKSRRWYDGGLPVGNNACRKFAAHLPLGCRPVSNCAAFLA
jgi:hypothetical protein